MSSRTLTEPEPESPRTKSSLLGRRPTTFQETTDRLSTLERLQIAAIRKTHQGPALNATMLWLQRHVGKGWIHGCTKNLLKVYGTERLPPLKEGPGLILVSNHRSFFDMFVITATLYRLGLDQRVVFPVRSTFFYDHPLGFFVNGIMSFFSMYPPIFRERKRQVLNHVAMSELAALIGAGGSSAGIHPEGTRNKGRDPYTLLPAQAGVGRLIHLSSAPVVPAFIVGLGNVLWRQVLGNFTRRGPSIHLVFGTPIDFGDLRHSPANGRTYRRLADRTVEAISALGQEERHLEWAD